mmetsp:Transcript_81650/g.127501  ORF Transcript_81650/g.127501 Transcript_81650/m.127501 type:complete len:283 (-) Transcript_81650:409-1257(-)
MSLSQNEPALSLSLAGRDNPIISKITDARLWRWNLGACVLHSLQGLLLLGASQGVPSVKNFKKDLTTSYLVFDKQTQALISETKNIGAVEIGLAAAIFLLLSAVAHGYVLLFWKVYIKDINMEINRARWYEYALSSSVMICAIAMLFGCYDIGSLILMFFVNASMNLFGLMMERLNPAGRTTVDWTPFIFGCIAGVAPWIVVLSYFLGGGNYGEIPGFVYGILFGYFVFFNTFPVNMVLQYARIGKWADYRFGELTYITLSLVSKSLLAWLVFGGTFQPNGN